MFTLSFTNLALEQLDDWKRSGQKKTAEKIAKLLEELTLHPQTGSGQPERLKGDMVGLWSRIIDKKNRLVYSINEGKVVVRVISMSGHYSDK